MHTSMFIVDKIVGESLVCENVETGEVCKFSKIKDVVEGDVIKIVDHKLVIDHEMTRIRRNRILDKVSRLEDKLDY